MSLIDRSKAEILKHYRLSELLAGNLRIELQRERELSNALAEALKETKNYYHVPDKLVDAALAQHEASRKTTD